ncbi:MAG TPA: hypothetical protein VLH75_17055 [Longimicrobiales bacterium]|nr:hypothetical protein [Longimicrobiales bacterium]
MAVSAEQVADAMYELVKECQGKKKLKALDLTKAMEQRFGDDCDKATCKAAIRSLVDSGRCIYTYFGGSYIEIPPAENQTGGG